MRSAEPHPTLLVVEDEPVIAYDLEDMLTGLGYRVLGPVTTLAEGLELAEAETLDGAVLDANLTDGTSLLIAERLKERGLPFVYVSGYDRRTLEGQRFPDGPALLKPVRSAALGSALDGVLG